MTRCTSTITALGCISIVGFMLGCSADGTPGFSGGNASNDTSSSNGTAQDAYSKTVSTICSAFASCCASGGGYPACASPKISMPTACKQNLAKMISGTESCSPSQVAQCLSDFKQLTCNQLVTGSLTMPSSCDGC